MSPQPTARATTTFSVSRRQFDSVPRRRGLYIVAYALYLLCIFGMRLLQAGQIAVPEPFTLASDIAGVAAFFLFSYHFIGTLKIMGYEPLMMLALGMIAALPIPGLMIVAYMDRRVATAWDKADPDRATYRQKPASYE